MMMMMMVIIMTNISLFIFQFIPPPCLGRADGDRLRVAGLQPARRSESHPNVMLYNMIQCYIVS